MCTIIAAIGLWPGLPLVIAANRDEALDRAASAPQVWPAGELADRRVLAPRDLVAGGTWLGLNDAGLFVGITNRRLPPDPSRRSRGELVLRALGVASRGEARARIRALEVADYNAFHLLLADRYGACVVWSDGARRHELELGPGVHAITERSFGAGESQRHDRLAQLGRELARGPAPSAEGWRSILADHRPHAPAGVRPGPTTVGLDSMCVHADPLNYGTRSSTLIELGAEADAVRWFHASSRPCEAELVEDSAAIAALRADAAKG